MYDYLAKIILLGPSGSGKYAQSTCSQPNYATSLISLRKDHVYSTASSKMNGAFFPRKLLALSSQVKSYEWAQVRGGRG